jgi:hypothetical protein
MQKAPADRDLFQGKPGTGEKTGKNGVLYETETVYMYPETRHLC